MSKNKQTNVTTQSVRTFNTKAFVISVVCVLTALVIAISLTIALWPQPADKTIADLDNPTIETSDATIKNGDFAYLDEEATAYPKLAQDWKNYSYKSKSGTNNQYYQTITTNDKSVMGIVNVDDWDNVSKDLSSYGLNNIANPGKADKADKDSNVYMIHNKQSYNASIYSQSFSVSASSSARIVVYLRTVDVQGAGAFVMVKQSSSYAQEYSTSGETYWYMHKGIKDEAVTGTTGWTKYEFYFFNQSSSSKTLYVNVGLGNVYTGEGATGTLFIDDIKYESVTANDYRENKDKEFSSYTVEKEGEANETSTLAFTTGDGVTTTTAGAYQLANTYSPFLNDDMTIYKISNDGKNKNPVVLTSNTLTVEKPSVGQHYLVSFWIRVVNETENVLPYANVYMYDNQNQDTPLASFTAQTTSKDLEKDTNNGWKQYYFYIKPTETNKELIFKVSFGDPNGYINESVIPTGSVLVSDATVEKITQSEYGNASSGDTVAKVQLGNVDTSSVVVNPSFSTPTNNANPGQDNSLLLAPQGWLPVYAGAVELTRNGKDNITVNDNPGSTTSGIKTSYEKAISFDDTNGAVLQITNNVKTAFGYISSDITLSANSIYVLSVMARSDSAEVKPSVYLIDQSSENSVNTSITKASSSNAIADSTFNLLTENSNGWTRYYFVVATGDTEKKVNMVLFNGEIDATNSTDDKVQQGTVYFDKVRADQIGTYSRDKSAEELYTKNDKGEWVLNQELVKEMTFTANDGYKSIKLDELFDLIEKHDNITLVDVRTSDVNTPTEDTTEEETPEEPTKEPVDVALIIGIVSSSLLVAALVIVVLMKFVFRKRA